LLCIFRLDANSVLELAPQNIDQPPAQDGMVISNENPNHLSYPFLAGTRTAAFVEAPSRGGSSFLPKLPG